MKNVEVLGRKRIALGKKEVKSIRNEGNVPCVLYGMGEKEVHFYAPMILFRELIYTNEAHFVNLNIEGEKCQAILQDSQFHPVSEALLHVDFLKISNKRKIKMNIPVRLTGQSPGVAKGGTLVKKRPYISVKAFPADIPESIDVDVSQLDFHHAIKVADLKEEKVEYLDPKRASVAVVEVPRAAKIAEEEVATDEIVETTKEATTDNKGDSKAQSDK